MKLESIEISGYRSIGNTLKFYSLGVYRVCPPWTIKRSKSAAAKTLPVAKSCIIEDQLL